MVNILFQSHTHTHMHTHIHTSRSMATCRIAGSSSNHSNHIEDDTEARGLGTHCKANTLVTLTYTVESQMDEGVSGLGTCQQDAVTTVIVDPDDIITCVKRKKTPPTQVTGCGSEDDPQYICQSCSKLTPLDSCYCTHCGHKRGRGRPRGVTGPKGQATGKTPRTKQDGRGEAGPSKMSPPPSSSSSPAFDPHGSQTSTPLRQANHWTVPIYRHGKPNLGKKSALHSKPQGNGSSVGRGRGEDTGHPQGEYPLRDPPTSQSSPVQCPVTTPIVTIPVYPEGDEPTDYHGNVDESPHVTPLRGDQQQLSVVCDDAGEGCFERLKTEDNSVVGGATHAARTGGCNWSNQSDHFPNISTSDQHSSSSHNQEHPVEVTPVHVSQWPQGSSNGPLLLPRPLVHPSEISSSRLSNQAPPPQNASSPLPSDNPDLVMFHIDMSVPGPHTTPVVMTVGNPKDSQIVGGDQPKYLLFQNRQPGEEASSGPTPHSTVFAPVFHPPLDHYASVSRSNGSSSVYSQATMGTAPLAGYQLLHQQNFVQPAPPGVVRCPTVVNAHGVPLHAVWTPAPPVKYERSGQGVCHQATYQLVESLPPPPSIPTRVPSSPLGLKQGSVGGRNLATPTNGGSSGWSQAAWMVPTSHTSWPHPHSIQSPPLVSAEQLGVATSMRALPPSALSTSSGSWTGHSSNSETQSPTVASSRRVQSPAPIRPSHLHVENGEHSIVVCDVGVMGFKEGGQQPRISQEGVFACACVCVCFHVCVCVCGCARVWTIT